MKKILIGGSMKYRDIIKNTMKELECLGFEAIFPNIDYTQENRDVAESIEEKSKLVWAHLKATEQVDAIYFILPNGYMGTSCKIELGYALALKKPIYFSEKTNDDGLDCFPKEFIKLEELDELKRILCTN
ncbi:MAG TPA: hypothetical protein DEP72_08790 [Clostridiales bacterium]|nr:MAG: hypothetical protein A2Y18_03730 [Clostridiales bacterium GWD2_32_19]HCC08235.1 hypothetical protein [Clostridiales bacterium]